MMPSRAHFQQVECKIQKRMHSTLYTPNLIPERLHHLCDLNAPSTNTKHALIITHTSSEENVVYENTN